MVGFDQKVKKKTQRRHCCCTMENNSPRIPEDMVVEILVRQPVLSIIKCKSVSKAWNRLISHKSFPVKRVSNMATTHLLIFRQCDHKLPIKDWHPKSEYVKIRIHDAIDKDKDDNHLPPSTTTTSLDMHFLPWQELRNMLTILDSCNGLILCWICSTSFLVINPSNQTWLPLPNPPFSCLGSSPLERPYRMALAFDPKISKHFKVVCPITSEDRLRVVFSSESGAWTTSKQVQLQCVRFNSRSMQLGCASLLIHGVLYMTSLHEIIRLNIHKETIELVHLPSEIILLDLSHLGVWKGELRFCEFRNSSMRMQVWKLDQDSSTDRWTLKHTLSFQLLFAGLNLLSPLNFYLIEACFHPDTDAIFLRIGKNNIIYYEFDTARKKVVILEDCHWSKRLLPLSPCLVNLFGAERDMEEIVAKKKLNVEVRQ